MTALVVLTVVEIVLLIAGLAFFLAWIGHAARPDRDQPRGLRGPRPHDRRGRRVIEPGLEHINRTGAVVAGALPLLYGFAERIIGKVSPNPERAKVAAPASGRRRSRLHDMVGYAPEP